MAGADGFDDASGFPHVLPQGRNDDLGRRTLGMNAESFFGAENPFNPVSRGFSITPPL